MGGGLRRRAEPLTEVECASSSRSRAGCRGSSACASSAACAPTERLVRLGRAAVPRRRAGAALPAPHADGAYRPLHLALGAFHETELAGRRLALRDVGERRSWRPAVRRGPGAGARLRRLRRWLADRAAGVQRPRTTWWSSRRASAPDRRAVHLLGGGSDAGSISTAARASAGGPTSAAAQLPGGGFAEFQRAITPGTTTRAERPLPLRRHHRGEPRSAFGTPRSLHRPRRPRSGTFTCTGGAGSRVTVASAPPARPTGHLPGSTPRASPSTTAPAAGSAAPGGRVDLRHELGTRWGSATRAATPARGPATRRPSSSALMRAFAFTRRPRGAPRRGRPGGDRVHLSVRAGGRAPRRRPASPRPPPPRARRARLADNSPTRQQARIEMKVGASAFPEC